GAEDEQKVCAFNVRNGEGDPVAEHEPAGKLLGHLVQRGRGKYIVGAELATETRNIHQQAGLVHGRIANHQGDGIVTVLRDDGRQAAFNLGEGFIPANGNMPAIAFDQWLAKTVRVFMQVFDRDTLGTEIAVAEDVGIMPANVSDLALFNSQFEPAAGFTKRADTVRDGFGHETLLQCRVVQKAP